MSIVTQEGVTKSQPMIFVGFSYPVYDDNPKEANIIAGCRLSVHRVYNHLKNEWGGVGRSKHLDGDGKLFSTIQEARQWAFEHGYLREWFRTPDPARKERRRRLVRLD